MQSNDSTRTRISPPNWTPILVYTLAPNSSFLGGFLSLLPRTMHKAAVRAPAMRNASTTRVPSRAMHAKRSQAPPPPPAKPAARAAPPPAPKPTPAAAPSSQPQAAPTPRAEARAEARAETSSRGSDAAAQVLAKVRPSVARASCVTSAIEHQPRCRHWPEGRRSSWPPARLGREGQRRCRCHRGALPPNGAVPVARPHSRGGCGPARQGGA